MLQVKTENFEDWRVWLNVVIVVYSRLKSVQVYKNAFLEYLESFLGLFYFRQSYLYWNFIEIKIKNLLIWTFNELVMSDLSSWNFRGNSNENLSVNYLIFMNLLHVIWLYSLLEVSYDFITSYILSGIILHANFE